MHSNDSFVLGPGDFANFADVEFLGANNSTVSLFDSFKDNGDPFNPRFSLDSVTANIKLGTLQPGDTVSYVYQLTAQGTTHGGEQGYVAFLGDPFGSDVTSGNLVLSTRVGTRARGMDAQRDRAGLHRRGARRPSGGADELSLSHATLDQLRGRSRPMVANLTRHVDGDGSRPRDRSEAGPLVPGLRKNTAAPCRLASPDVDIWGEAHEALTPARMRGDAPDPVAPAHRGWTDGGGREPLVGHPLKVRRLDRAALRHQRARRRPGRRLGACERDEMMGSRRSNGSAASDLGEQALLECAMPTLLWMECGACSGESMAILGAEGPGMGGDNLPDFLESSRLQLLWHPSLSLESPKEVEGLIERILAGEQELTLLCVEGSIIHGPDGTGMFDTFCGKPKRDIIAALCDKADYVLAMGTCAAFGGIPAAPPNPTESSGLQFRNDRPGGLLSPEWRSRAGYPVLNLAGCPVDAATMIKTMGWILNEAPLELDAYNRPSTVGPCLSNGLKKKCGTAEKVGYACYGCIGAKFPASKPLFRHVITRNLAGVC